MNGFLVGRQTLCTIEGEIKGWGGNCPLAPPKILYLYIYIYNGFPLCIYFLYFFYVKTNELCTFQSSNFTKKEKYFLFY